MAKSNDGKRENGEGSTRRLSKDRYECIVQSKYINPKTGKPKRITRIRDTESAAREKAQMDLAAWEKGIA